MADIEKEILLKISSSSTLKDTLKDEIKNFEELEEAALKAIKEISDETVKANKLAEFEAGREQRRFEATIQGLSNTAEATHKYRNAIDDVVERLNIFGDKGSALVAELNKISDPIKRAELATKAFNSESFKSGGILGKYTEKIQATKVAWATSLGGVENLTLAMGAATAGVGLLVGAVGTALVGAFSYALSSAQAYIDKQRELAKGTEDGSEKARELVRSFDDLKRSQDALEQSAGKLVTNLTGASRIAGAFAVTVSQTSGAVDRLANSEEQFNTILGTTAAIFPQYTPQLLLLKRTVDSNSVSYKNTTKAADILTFTFKAQADAAKVLELSLGGVASKLLEIQRNAQNATPYLTALGGFDSTTGSRQSTIDSLKNIKTQGGAIGGGGDKKQNQIAIDFSDTAKTTLSELFNGLANKVGGSIVGIGLALSGARDTNNNNIASSQQSQSNNVSGAIGAASSQVGKGLDTGFKQANTEAEALKNQTDALYGSFLNLGVGITDAFLAFSVGASSGQQVLSGILSNVGNLATQLGTFFILLGTAEGSSGFLGLQGTAAAAAGASLIAFGAGLKAGAAAAGAAGAKEARNRRSSIIKAPSANNLPQAQNSNITVILEVEGDRFVRTIAPNITRQARQGAVRIPSTSIIPN